MVDSNPLDPTAYTTHPLQAPAAPLSAEEIKELRPTASEVAFGRQFAIGSGTLSRLLDALEALTAENARLTAERDDLARRLRMSADMLKGCDQDTLMHDAAEREMVAEIGTLKAEVERLTANVIDLSDQLKLEETCRILREIEDEDELRRLCARDDDEDSPPDHGWYTRHRLRIEAAHAAAKAERLWNGPMDDVIAAIQPALAAAAKEPAGIDMALLGKLCREEPDEATKREVAEMMDTIRWSEVGK